MAKRISDSERVDQIFMAADRGAAERMYERVTLILKTKGVIVPQKRTRKTKAKDATPPIH